MLGIFHPTTAPPSDSITKSQSIQAMIKLNVQILKSSRRRSFSASTLQLCYFVEKPLPSVDDHYTKYSAKSRYACAYCIEKQDNAGSLLYANASTVLCQQEMDTLRGEFDALACHEFKVFTPCVRLTARIAQTFTRCAMLHVSQKHPQEN